jgi:hypothetical protein
MAVDWDNLTKEDVVWLHGWNRDGEIRSHGHGDMLDEYLSSVAQGITWNPNDMDSTPPTPGESRLDQAGRRHTVSLADIPEGAELPPYTEWSHDDLVFECRERGLSEEGSDDELAVRLLENDDEADSRTLANYSTMKKDELQNECRNRGLSDEGKVDELRSRLQEDDATRSE